MNQDFDAAFKAFEQRMLETQELKHQEISKQIDDLKGQLTPIVKVYAQVTGFGDVAIWIFKYIVIPFSIILGVVLNWKNIAK